MRLVLAPRRMKPRTMRAASASFEWDQDEVEPVSMPTSRRMDSRRPPRCPGSRDRDPPAASRRLGGASLSRVAQPRFKLCNSTPALTRDARRERVGSRTANHEPVVDSQDETFGNHGVSKPFIEADV